MLYNYFQIFLDGCLLVGDISESTYDTFVEVIWSNWNEKLKEGKNLLGSTFAGLVEGLIVALGKLCESPVILWKKMQVTFILKLVLQNMICF